MYQARGTRERRHTALLGVKWRFLSDSSGLKPSTTTPWTEEAHRRISYLERALASTHDLEAQYDAFLKEVSSTGASNDRPLDDWGSVRAILDPPTAPGASDMIPSDPSDLIPSDPAFSAPRLPKAGRRSGLRSRETAAASRVLATTEGNGSVVAEDSEVGRMQSSATGEVGTDHSDEKRAPSPVIIWRHAAPVRIAENVPADLLPFEPAEPNGSRRSLQSSSAAGVALIQQERPLVHGTRSEEQRLQEVLRMQKRSHYGAWYLPVSEWNSRLDATPAGGAAGQKLRPGSSASRRPSGGGNSPPPAGDEASEDDEGQSFTETIPKLYSSRVYKEYLQSRRINRIPHFLHAVEPSSPSRVEPPIKSPFASRASISILETPTTVDRGSQSEASPLPKSLH